MPRRYLVGLVVAAAFLLVNLVGIAVAATAREVPHAGLHVALSLLGAYLVWWLAARGRAHRVRPRVGADSPAASAELTSRLASLEQSVDAVAVEVERVGEGQRFMTRLVTEGGASAAAGAGVAEPGKPDR